MLGISVLMSLYSIQKINIIIDIINAIIKIHRVLDFQVLLDYY